jgi:hypothetical protein
MATIPADETCVTCGNAISSAYCPNCGERRAADRRYSLLAFGREAFEAFAEFDGRFFRTLKALLRRPGELTAAYMRGERLPYVGPLQTFLWLNLIYFLWASWSGLHLFNTTLRVHMRGTPYAPVATGMVYQRLGGDTAVVTRAAVRQYAQVFDAVGTAESKTLVIAMVPLFAVAVAILAGGRRRYIVQHLVFSLHTYAFVFVLAIVGTYLIGWPIEYAIRWLHIDAGENGADSPMALVMFLCIAAYLALSLRRAYGFGWTRAIVTALLLGVAFGEALTLYRELLFFTTLHAT